MSGVGPPGDRLSDIESKCPSNRMLTRLIIPSSYIIKSLNALVKTALMRDTHTAWGKRMAMDAFDTNFLHDYSTQLFYTTICHFNI